ncbi:hypothetical protein G9A89_003214 [Geosiphon pyriformis]|nr:hypothetical protein G9A89_003214 [Geosiphon pyriformis]
MEIKIAKKVVNNIQRKSVMAELAFKKTKNTVESIDIEEDEKMVEFYEPEIPFQKTKSFGRNNLRSKITQENSVHNYPPQFKVIFGEKHPSIKYFEELRRNRLDRWQRRAVIIQGIKNIRELIDKGHQIRSIVATAPTQPPFPKPSEITGATQYLLENLDQFPAEKYYITDQQMTRKVLGQWALLGNWEVWAEVPFPPIQYPQTIKKLLVLERIVDPYYVGQLIRAAKSLGWDGVFLFPSAVDVYDDRVMRQSRYRSIFFPHSFTDVGGLKSLIKQHDLTLMAAEPIPPSMEQTSTLSDMGNKKISSIHFWHEINGVLKKTPPLSGIALMIGTCVNGTLYSIPENTLRVAIPTINNVKLNAGMAGVVLMSELNHLVDT